jgi:hypothetical protein
MIEDWTPHSKWHTRASGFSQEQEGKEKGRAGNKKVARLLVFFWSPQMPGLAPLVLRA